MRAIVPILAAMPDFASVLESVERAAAEADATPWRSATSRIGARLIDPAAAATPDRAAARAAYAAHTARSDVDAKTEVARALRRAIIGAGRDAKALRELRRRAARELHPDRGGDGALLAECNALIDAALAQRC